MHAYAFLGERGETQADRGEQTREEMDLGFAFFNERSPEASKDDYWEREDLTYPSEENVMAIAGRWSVDPSQLGIARLRRRLVVLVAGNTETSLNQRLSLTKALSAMR